MRYLAAFLYFYLGVFSEKLAQLSPRLKFVKAASDYFLSTSKYLDEYNLIEEHRRHAQKKNKN